MADALGRHPRCAACLPSTSSTESPAGRDVGDFFARAFAAAGRAAIGFDRP
jgi:hypothetical protein